MPAAPARDVSCAEKLKILSDPTRLSVVEILMSGPQRVTAMMVATGVEQSLLSHHLKVLRDAGFVVTRRDGKGVLYSLSPDFRPGNDPKLDLGCCEISFADRRVGDAG